MSLLEENGGGSGNISLAELETRVSVLETENTCQQADIDTTMQSIDGTS